MIGAEEDGNCWYQAFETMIGTVWEERLKTPEFATELEMLDDVTDYMKQ